MKENEKERERMRRGKLLEVKDVDSQKSEKGKGRELLGNEKW